jgi:hypothetical protein
MRGRDKEPRNRLGAGHQVSELTNWLACNPGFVI